VDRLTKSGLVARRPNPEDGRGVLAEITPDGRVVVEKATADLRAAQFGLGALDSDQHRALFETLRTLRLAAGDFTDAGTTGTGITESGE
jgi:DNA-binding MarR family transcriptional regulator